MPKRVRLCRDEGWRMPENTVKVDRSTKWGNPFRVGIDAVSHVDAVIAFDTALANDLIDYPDPRELRGKNLACWCPLIDKDGNRVPCHADVLLELANATTDTEMGR